jgi:hypothetical protein
MGLGGAEVPWGVGIQVAGTFGGSTGYRAYGHGGRTGRAMHDPAEDLTIVYLTNGLCTSGDNESRCTELTDRVQEVLTPRPSSAWVTRSVSEVGAR